MISSKLLSFFMATTTLLVSQTPSDIQKFLENPNNHWLISLSLKDEFMENGTFQGALLRHTDKEWVLCLGGKIGAYDIQILSHSGKELSTSRRTAGLPSNTNINLVIHPADKMPITIICSEHVTNHVGKIELSLDQPVTFFRLPLVAK